jgi:hypothetical protein
MLSETDVQGVDLLCSCLELQLLQWGQAIVISAKSCRQRFILDFAADEGCFQANAD